MELLEVLAVVVAVGLAWAVLRSLVPERTTPPRRPAVRITQPAPIGGSARRSEGSTRLFGYGIRATGPTLTGHRHQGPYAMLSIATTGLSPTQDRIVEIAVVRLAADGRPTEAWSTLLNPGSRPLGLGSVHGLTEHDLDDAPEFADIAGHLVSMLGGAVVLAHNADYVEGFLLHEFLRTGLLAPSVPALCATRLSQLTVPTRNHRLGTVAAHLGLRHSPDGSAAAEAATLADLAPHLLVRHSGSLVYPVPPLPELPRSVGSRGVPPGHPRTTRPPAAAADPWLDNLMRNMSISALEIHDARAAAYVEMLTTLLSRGHVVTAEARELTGLAAQAGFAPSALRAILERFCELLRQVAFETTPTLGPTHLRHLRAVATSVRLPGYFDDLIPPTQPKAPEPGSGTFSRPVRKPLPLPPPPRAARCGHCLSIGHYTSECPRRGRRALGPVPPVNPIDPI
ncbi:MAG: exonuclease domain-containing protein [Dermatophilus congolensis]|nr:exonuclease domain-containing protein [Dermatophilus congolensis]